MLAAVGLVGKGMSIRKAADAQGINYRTLSRYVKVKSDKGNLDGASFGYVKARQVFSDDMEQCIVEYIVHAASIFHGLTLAELRQFAFDLSIANNLNNIPKSWSVHKMAGSDWAYSFMKRHESDIAICTPEATFVQRMT